MKKLLFALLTLLFASPLLASAATKGYEIPLQESIGSTHVIAGDTGMELVTVYVSTIYTYGASILGIICVLIIVISGIQISMGGAQADLVSQAKTRIMQALLSLAILFLSAVILRTINPGFFNYKAPPVQKAAQEQLKKEISPTDSHSDPDGLTSQKVWKNNQLQNAPMNP